MSSKDLFVLVAASAFVTARIRLLDWMLARWGYVRTTIGHIIVYGCLIAALELWRIAVLSAPPFTSVGHSCIFQAP